MSSNDLSKIERELTLIRVALERLADKHGAPKPPPARSVYEDRDVTVI